MAVFGRLSALLLLAPLPLIFAQQPDEFFEKKIRPVLVAKCQVCHNSKLKTAGLDLSTAADFALGGPSGPLIAAKPKDSRLLKVIGYDDKLKMPPMGKLAAEDLESFAAWVKLGAPWPGGAAIAPAPAAAIGTTRVWSPEQKAFWAFQPVKPVEPPKVVDEKWIRSPIDRFILAKLEAQGLHPSPPAGKLTLLRRATFDLTGLPPSEDEVRQFRADRSPQAFEKVIDRLLDSPRYGERWGRHWLDVARYADSTGNDEDHRYPYAWRYRDYVIDAFNRDLPFNQFVREQIAGDLLPSETGQVNREGIVATGFLALGSKALAQKDKQKMLYDVYDEQVDVTTRAFLGLTVACARCHDHKFDPIATKDYYALTGIFASTKSFASTGGKGDSSLLYKPLCEDSEFRTYNAYKRVLNAKTRQINDVYDIAMEKRTSALAPRIADYMMGALRVYKDHESAAKIAAAESMDLLVLKRWANYLQDGAAGRPHLEAWANADSASLRAVALDYQKKYVDRLSEYDAQLAKWREATAKADAAMKQAPGKPASVSPEIDPFFSDLTLQGPFTVAGRRRKGGLMNLDKDVELQKKLAEKKLREREVTITADELLSPEARARVKALNDELADITRLAPSEPDMADAVEEGKPVEQHVFVRGDYNSPGEVAPKLFPSVLAKPDDPKIAAGSGRAELAGWLTRPDHPLTGRVFVNRMWYWHFGEGIVRTPDNFGRMGERPTHPELLDYLASEFAGQGWSVKRMHRTMMLSSAYQMASTGSDEAFEKDPENRLLSHFQRRRLDVEEIRDGLLALDGSLDLEMGGTLQTGFGTDGENSSGRLSMNPEKLTRRTVYVPLRRANLPTLLNLFDFGDATTVTGKRALTTVAPQALFAMNSDFVTDRARNVAESVLEHVELTDAQRMEHAFMRTLNRPPNAAEQDSALTFIHNLQQKFNRTEVEAWQSFCRALLASNEFIYVD